MTRFIPKYERWVKPLKRSQKVRLRKELAKRQKEYEIKSKNEPKLEKCDWAPSKLIFGGKSRVIETGWEYKLL